MKPELTREQMLMAIEHARYQRSLAAGEMSATAIRGTLRWLGRALDHFLHALRMSPSAPR